MKLISLAFTFLLFINISLPGQTSLSGILNDYAVVEEIDTCNSSIRVNDISFFQQGDRVLLIQMQGATISQNNNSSFGQINDLGGAGLYEMGTIKGLTANNVLLENTILNDYEIAGKVQLVRVPVYVDAIVNGRVTALPWNGQTGGIIAFEVDNELTFSNDGEIDASELGFRGGESISVLPNDCSWFNISNNYFYNSNSWRGAAKGEGIASLIAGKEAGKGAQANGGGGGNDHNSGGGGGANQSSGGDGGNNEEPSTFGCKGRNPGLGGKKINAAGTQRIFMGGGGGAGHGNNNNGSDGGNGGGIIMIKAATISVANNNTGYLWLLGGSPAQTLGDGAGGGGAGGSLLLQSPNFNVAGTLVANAEGGDGGTTNNQNANRCFGPGGGGSGGWIATNGFSGSAPNWLVTVERGFAGLSINSNDCSNSTNGGEDGDAGQILQFPGFVESSQVNEPLSISQEPIAKEACLGEGISFSIETEGIGIAYQWQMDSGSGFMNISDGGSFSGTQSSVLNIDPVLSSHNGVSFRCVVENFCFGTLTSAPALLTVVNPPVANFNFTLTNFTANFTDLSSNATNFNWDFGDGQTSTDFSPSHTYAMDGNYTVVLTATNICGSDTYTLVVNINTVVAPVAVFSLDASMGCSPLTIQFTDESLNNPTTWNWTFSGGVPGTSTVQNPTVVYNTPGVYPVSLIVSNSAGNDEEMMVGAVTVLDLPNADFTFGLTGSTATFNNGSLGGTTYLWDFGDGQTSTDISPTHTYAMDGNYTVTLSVTNACGTATYSEVIQVTSELAPLANFNYNVSQGCAPFTVAFSDASVNEVNARLWTFIGGTPATSTAANPVVTYNQPGLFDVILEVSNAAGTNQILEENAIAVEVLPQVSFSYDQNGYTFSFTNDSQDATSYAWDFGDGGAISSAENPVHTYASDGAYLVTLTASNAFCSSIKTLSVSIFLSGNTELTNAANWNLYPNPAQDLIFLEREEKERAELKIFSSDGRLQKAQNLAGESLVEIPIGGLSTGIYFFQIQTANSVYLRRVVIY